MGRLQVRRAVQSAIQGAGIPYLGTVYPARPTLVSEYDYIQTMSGQAVAASSNGSASVAVVNIPSDRRVRKAAVGRGMVQDADVHQIALEVFFASTSGEGAPAQEDYDSIVDAVTVFVRNNPTLGDPSVVWSAGEFSPGVAHEQGAPYTSEDGLTLLINGVIRFEAWEWLAGQGV